MTDTSPSRAPSRAAPEKVAVVIPCHNEATTIAKVVRDFRQALPDARILVVDNASSDTTEEIARQAGAEVFRETRLGKGFALVRGFREASDADYLLMVDGDDTYPAKAAPALLEAARDGADMVIGTRLEEAGEGAFPTGHGFGNRLFIFLARTLFGIRTQDLFSGYRVLTRRFLERSPLIAEGFEIEAELSMQALVHRFQVAEIPVPYRARREGSDSKLRTLRDGYRILLAILAFFRDYRPLTFFGLAGLVLLALSLAGGGVVIAEFVRTGLVLRIPLAILSAGLFILSALAFACGVLLSSINRRAAELATLIRQK